jgi:thioredoxin-like negative regulator of GroEL
MTQELETRRLLVEGVQALLAGQREEAQRLLMACVEQDERNEEAWLWLSGAVDDPADVKVALENCLDVNPNNERAKEGLQWLQQYNR